MRTLFILGIPFATLAMALAAPADSEFTDIDLQPQANQKLADPLGSGRAGNDLAEVPKGEQTFEGVKFKIDDGFLQLNSPLLKEQRAKAIEGIPVGKPFAKLHILHSTAYGNGMVIGQEGAEGGLTLRPGCSAASAAGATRNGIESPKSKTPGPVD